MTSARFQIRVQKCMKITGFSKEQVELLIDQGFKPETDDLTQVRFWVAAEIPNQYNVWETK